MTCFVNLNWFIRAATVFFQSLLDEGGKLSNKFFTTDYAPFLDEIIGLDKVQEKYGGQLPNIEEGDTIFPPRFNL